MWGKKEITIDLSREDLMKIVAKENLQDLHHLKFEKGLTRESILRHFFADGVIEVEETKIGIILDEGNRSYEELEKKKERLKMVGVNKSLCIRHHQFMTERNFEVHLNSFLMFPREWEFVDGRLKHQEGRWGFDSWEPALTNEEILNLAELYLPEETRSWAIDEMRIDRRKLLKEAFASEMLLHWKEEEHMAVEVVDEKEVQSAMNKLRRRKKILNEIGVRSAVVSTLPHTLSGQLVEWENMLSDDFVTRIEGNELEERLINSGFWKTSSYSDWKHWERAKPVAMKVMRKEWESLGDSQGYYEWKWKWGLVRKFVSHNVRLMSIKGRKLLLTIQVEEGKRDKGIVDEWSRTNPIRRAFGADHSVLVFEGNRMTEERFRKEVWAAHEKGNWEVII